MRVRGLASKALAIRSVGNRTSLAAVSNFVLCGTKDLLTDPLGSLVREIASGASLGSLVEMYPYGTLVKNTGAATTSFVFVATYGYYTDSSSRDYVRARELMKSIGRWLQIDPYWPEEFGYLYADTSPMAFTDACGRRPQGKGRGQNYLSPPPDCTPGLLEVLGSCIPSPGCFACLYGVGKGLVHLSDNAIRHCSWGCEACRQCGCLCSQRIEWKELIDQLRGDTIEDSACDVVNNGLGRGLCEKYPRENCVDLCRRAKREQRLCEVEPRPTRPPRRSKPPVPRPVPKPILPGDQVRGGSSPIWQ